FHHAHTTCGHPPHRQEHQGRQLHDRRCARCRLSDGRRPGPGRDRPCRRTCREDQRRKARRELRRAQGRSDPLRLQHAAGDDCIEMIAAGLALQSSDVTPEHYLRRLGESGEGPHDIAMAALMLAALDHPSTRLTPFYAHLSELGEAVNGEAAFVPDGEAAARALAHVLSSRYGYDGDRMEYEEPGNADLISVMERRRGLPVALGILYMHAARAAGLTATGLFSPGHFLLKVAVKG